MTLKRILITMIIFPAFFVIVFFPGLSMGADHKGLIVGTSWGPGSNPPDPAKNWDGWYLNEIGVTETLMALDFDQKLVPLLAESCTNISPTTWEIRLKAGITFHDGAPLNAEAVKWNFDRFLDEKSNTFNERMAQLLSIKNIHVKDDKTVVFETIEPLASFANKLADTGTGLISPLSEGKGTFGTGPFQVKAFFPNEKMIAERYEGYWGKKALLPRVTFVYNKDSQAKMLAFEAGDLDLLPLFPEMDIQRIEKDPRFQIYNRETNRICYLVPRINSGPLADPNIRMALNYAIDRKEIVEVVLSGIGGTVGSGIFPNVLPWHNQSLSPYPYDPEKAKALLRQAGVTDSDGDGMLEYQGDPIKLRMWTYSGRPSLRPTLELVQAQLKRIGIDSQIRVSKSGSTNREAMKNNQADLILSLSSTAPQGDPDYFVSTWLGAESSLNCSQYKNEELGKLLAKGRTTFDFEARKAIYDRIQKIIYEENPMMVLFYKSKVSAGWNHVKNYRVHPAEIYVIRPEMAIER
ncbi:ABC transporter substrate-binding protein [Desulfocicer niacini]